MRKYLLLMVIFLLILVNSLFAGCESESEQINGLYDGYAEINCTFCEEENYMNCNLAYYNFSNVKGLVANGSTSATVTVIDEQPMIYVFGVSINGGPINYNYNGQLLEVYFNYLNFDLHWTQESTFVTDMKGGLTVNGQYYFAFPGLFNILF